MPYRDPNARREAKLRSYYKHRDSHLERAAARRAQLWTWVNLALVRRGCSYCQSRDYNRLLLADTTVPGFDLRRIHRMISQRRPLITVVREVERRQVVCDQCLGRGLLASTSTAIINHT